MKPTRDGTVPPERKIAILCLEKHVNYLETPLLAEIWAWEYFNIARSRGKITFTLYLYTQLAISAKMCK